MTSSADLPNILLINHEFPPIGGGAATATANIAKELRILGARVTVLTSAYMDLPAYELWEGCDILRIPALRKRVDSSDVFEMLSFLFSSMWWVIRHSAKQNVDACIAFFGIPAGPAAWLLEKRRSIPYIISLRGGDVPGFLPEALRNWHRLSGWLIRFLWCRAAFVVANSQGLAVLAREFSPELQVLVIPNGVDTAWLEQVTPSSHAPPLPGENLPAGIRLITTGRLNIQKNYPCLLRALAELPEKNWTLEFIGDGPERDDLQNLAQNLGIADRVLFRGWLDRNDVLAHLTQADVYIFPSIQEGMPNSVLEAMSAALPVIACMIEGCEELVVDGETGILVPPNDAAALQDAVAQLMDAPELRKKMGIAGRTRMQKHYTWQATSAAYLSLCQKNMEV
jgi:glycosyltransferase involved in cell wall biosynthesis